MNISREVSRVTFFRRRYHQGRMFLRIAASAVLVAVFSVPQLAAATYTTVRMVTNLGTIDIQLYDDDQAPDQAPITVTNFLRYAGRGDYNNNVIHRSVPGFIIQGGGHTYLPNPFTGQPVFFKTPTDAPIQNEFSPSRSNVRGTIAMAKLPNNPNSATNEWFFNLSDSNAANLDSQNGGFTVFGQVLTPAPGTGMDVVDAIAALTIFDGANNYPFYYPCNPDPISGLCTNPTYFLQLPTINYDPTSYINGDPTTYLQVSNLVFVTGIPNVAATRTQIGTGTKTTSAYAGDVDVTLSNPNSNRTVDPTTSALWLQTFTTPPGKIVQFNDEISTFTMTWTTGPSARVVTLYHGSATTPNRYYAYGKTPDNLTDHWYDFTFDSTTGTGAEFVGNKILLHFVDGQRGDNDSTANSITHIGAPALVTDIPSTNSSNSSGCTIAAIPSQSTGNGDWVVVSMFLAFVALVRRRTRRDRIQRASR